MKQTRCLLAASSTTLRLSMARCQPVSRRACARALDTTRCTDGNAPGAPWHWWTQVLAFSATYTEVLLAQLRQLTTFPQEVMLCPETVTLRGACDISHLPEPL